MKQIKKYINQQSESNFASKLASYGVMAAAVMACPTDISAQCGTAAAGAPLGVDIDGDGVADVNLAVANFPGPYLLSSYTLMTGPTTITVPTSFTFTATVVPPGPGTSWNGCITTNYGGFTAIDPNATAMGPIMVTGSYIYAGIVATTNVYIVYSVNVAYATGAAIIGLTASGASICPSGAGGITPASNIAYLGTQFCYGSIYFQNASIASTMINLNPTGTVILDHPPCTTTGGNYYAGLFQSLMFLPFTATYPGTAFTATGSNTLGCNTIPGNTFLGVQFVGGDGDTYNGWVEVMFNDDGTVTCVDNGYQMCSIESATGAGDPSFSCIPVGTATNANAGCDVAPPAECDADGGAWPSGN